MNDGCSVAIGEMAHAYNVLSSLLNSSEQNSMLSMECLPRVPLSYSAILRLAKAISLQAFSARLVMSGKDMILRKVYDLLREAAVNIFKGLVKDDLYWPSALKIRKGSWELAPAPLPIVLSSRKNSERSAKGFLVAFGLENCQTL